MKFPISNENQPETGHCYSCNGIITNDPIALTLDGMQWEAGRVSQQMRNDPEFMPGPAMMPRLINAEFRLRLLDVNVDPTAGRYLTVISSNNAEVSFCSTACLRNFFNTVVDTFEQSYVSK